MPPFSLCPLPLPHHPVKSKDTSGQGAGSGTSSAVPAHLGGSWRFTRQTTHSPEDYGLGRFSTWARAPLTPVRKENIRELLLLSLSSVKAPVRGGMGERVKIWAPRVGQKSGATLPARPQLHVDMAPGAASRNDLRTTLSTPVYKHMHTPLLLLPRELPGGKMGSPNPPFMCSTLPLTAHHIRKAGR